MSDWILAQLVDQGIPLMFLITLLSCLALPVPASLAMLASGAFAAGGDLPLATTALAALIGALCGDQAGYWAGRLGAGWIDRMLAHGNASAVKATQYLKRRGGLAVFLSRWLASPLGPYVNFAAGAARLNWPRFTAAAALGEAVWVSLYVGLGYGFASSLTTIAEIAGDISGALAGLAVMAAAAFWISHARHERRERRKKGT